MSDARASFARAFRAALARHLDGGGEATLQAAYALGRCALNEGIGVLDLVLVHHDALAALNAAQPPADYQTFLDCAAEFLAESLSPFEMTLRGYRDANRELTELNDRLKTEISERQRAEEALLQAQRLQAVGRLAGGVAHHFNNLLTAVIGNIYLAQRRLTGSRAIEQPLAAAVRAAERGAKLTQQLLAFSRTQTLHPERIDPSTRLPEIVALLRGALRDDIQFDTDIPTNLWPINVDQMELELALLNLGINARDAMPGGGRLELRAENAQIEDARLGLSGTFVVIELSDSGCGIPAEIQSRVFDPFFTTKDVGDGTGLGLSQVHGFASQSGGAVHLDSTVGKGTTVRLYLPASHDGTKAKVDTKNSDSHEHTIHGTVLIVEDDIGVAEVAGQLLEGCGFTIKLAYRGHEALDLLQTGDPIDLVFTDIVMPGGIDGLQLADEVNAHYPGTRVLLTTGYSDALESAMARGLCILPKPYRARELCDAVTALVATRLSQ